MKEGQRGLRASRAGHQDLAAACRIDLHGQVLAVVGDEGHRPARRDRGCRRQRDRERRDRRVVARQGQAAIRRGGAVAAD